MRWFVPLHVASWVEEKTETVFVNSYVSPFLHRPDDSRPYQAKEHDIVIGQSRPWRTEADRVERQTILRDIIYEHEIGWYSYHAASKGPIRDTTFKIVPLPDSVAQIEFALRWGDRLGPHYEMTDPRSAGLMGYVPRFPGFSGKIAPSIREA